MGKRNKLAEYLREVFGIWKEGTDWFQTILTFLSITLTFSSGFIESNFSSIFLLSGVILFAISNYKVYIRLKHFGVQVELDTLGGGGSHITSNRVVRMSVDMPFYVHNPYTTDIYVKSANVICNNIGWYGKLSGGSKLKGQEKVSSGETARLTISFDIMSTLDLTSKSGQEVYDKNSPIAEPPLLELSVVIKTLQEEERFNLSTSFSKLFPIEIQTN